MKLVERSKVSSDEVIHISVFSDKTIAVSYTHLDVYKRQYMKTALCLMVYIEYDILMNINI